MIFALFLVIFLAIIEGIFISFPLVLVFLTIFTLKRKSNYVFLLSFIGGIILDIFYLRQIGTTAFFLLVFTLSLLSYGKKFETDSIIFVFAALFLGSFSYFLLFQPSNVLSKAFEATAISFLIWLFLNYVQDRSGFS